MNYTPKHFNLPPKHTVAATDSTQPYVFSEDILIAVDVALATGRPLLVAGPPGCGKSRLAEAMAAVKGWNYLYHTMTSRTRLEELTGEMDHLRRLHDAQANDEDLKPDWAYRNPGIFWWAFKQESALYRGGSPESANEYKVTLAYPGVKRPQENNRHVAL